MSIFKSIITVRTNPWIQKSPIANWQIPVILDNNNIFISSVMPFMLMPMPFTIFTRYKRREININF